ncbi:MAG TPA: putative ABC exporter domain-containing protein [Thermoanaerobaculia bacterium]
MIRAFLFVTIRSWINRIVWRARRLKNPRYLISFLVAIGYFGFLFFRPGGPGRRAVTFSQVPTEVLSLLPLAILLLAWLLPGHSALEFSEGEQQFLFTGPLSRAQILFYKLLRAQPQVLLTIVILSLFRLPNGHVVGLWLVVNALNIYMTFVALARPRLRRAGIHPLVQGLIGAALAGIVGWLVWYDFAAGGGLDEPAVRAILFIPGLFAQALFATSVSSVALSWSGVAAFAALLFFAASRLRVPFEELAMTASQARASLRERMQNRNSGATMSIRRFPPLFRLRDRVPPEVAILWKNMIAAMRISSPWILIMGLLFGAFLFQSFHSTDASVRDAMAICALVVCAGFPLLGTALFQQDFRLDLPRLELLKSWPVRPDRLVIGELAAPLAVVASMEIAMLTAAGVLLSHASGKIAALARPEIFVIALLFAIPVSAAQLVLRNAVPLYFPAWIVRSKEDQRGLVMTGQRLLGIVANFVFLALVLAPAGIVGTIGFIVASRVASGPAFYAVAIMPAVALLVVEVWLGVKLLATQFEKLDIQEETVGGQ